jgi:hypothetical protein
MKEFRNIIRCTGMNIKEAEHVLQLHLGSISVSASIPKFLGHIPFSHFLSYVTSLAYLVFGEVGQWGSPRMR